VANNNGGGDREEHEEDQQEEEEQEEDDLFVFNEGPRAPAVKPGRITQA
jgi:hypothetical protein